MSPVVCYVKHTVRGADIQCAYRPSHLKQSSVSEKNDWTIYNHDSPIADNINATEGRFLRSKSMQTPCIDLVSMGYLVYTGHRRFELHPGTPPLLSKMGAGASGRPQPTGSILGIAALDISTPRSKEHVCMRDTSDGSQAAKRHRPPKRAATGDGLSAGSGSPLRYSSPSSSPGRSQNRPWSTSSLHWKQKLPTATYRHAVEVPPPKRAAIGDGISAGSGSPLRDYIEESKQQRLLSNTSLRIISDS